MSIIDYFKNKRKKKYTEKAKPKAGIKKTQNAKVYRADHTQTMVNYDDYSGSDTTSSIGNGSSGGCSSSSSGSYSSDSGGGSSCD